MQIPSNPRQPTKTNPIKIRKLVIFPEILIYKNREFSYTDISKLAFDWKTFSELTLGSIWNLKMEFNLHSIHKRIKVKTLDNMFFNISMKKFKEFYYGYHYMAKRSYNSRYQSYLDEFSEKGYFKYDDYLFFKDRITVGKDYEVILNDGSKYLRKHKYGIILLTKEKVKPNFVQKILPYSPNMVGAFTNDIDIDILEKLLDEFYGLHL
ncbi:MAG: hypothetical protein H8E71_03040 [Candidatus Marinimicrobia bacterium]|nr:hypothetical protein [Candidatus Neomarinimicrobiota bacterium]